MTFHEVQLPPRISYGAVGGPKFKTTVLTLASGFERRLIEWASVRGEWDVAYGIKTTDEMNLVRSFFMARYGKAYGFRFKDWMDFKLPRQLIGATDAETTTFQIYKRYQDGANFYDRDIKKPVAAGYVDGAYSYVGPQVWVDGVEISPGAGAGEYQLDSATGVITLGADLAATTGQGIEVACEFDVPVRFDTDHLAQSIEDYGVHNWQQIPLVEVRL